MRRTAGAHDDSIAKLRRQLRMMLEPSHCYFAKREVVFISCLLDGIQRIKLSWIPVAALMHLALKEFWVKARAWLELRLVPRITTRQEAASERLEGVQRDTVVAEARNNSSSMRRCSAW